MPRLVSKACTNFLCSGTAQNLLYLNAQVVAGAEKVSTKRDVLHIYEEGKRGREKPLATSSSRKKFVRSLVMLAYNILQQFISHVEVI